MVVTVSLALGRWENRSEWSNGMREGGRGWEELNPFHTQTGLGRAQQPIVFVRGDRAKNHRLPLDLLLL